VERHEFLLSGPWLAGLGAGREAFQHELGILSILGDLAIQAILGAMPTVTEPRTRGHRKREKTRSQLIAAGLRVLAERGEALTVSDVVAEADVSNGTFYNYFADREALVDALAAHSVLALAEDAARETADADPALRFAVATGRVLRRAQADPTWGRVVMRLVNLHAGVGEGVSRYLEADLSAGRAQGRFERGPDDVTLDLLLGLILMAIRRIVEGRAAVDYAETLVARALAVLGVPAAEAREIAGEALAAPGSEGD
jgi:AcrR family transcriptional regulator